MVQLAALALNPSTFDPMRASLAGSNLLGSQIQNASSALQFDAARQQQQALADFGARGGFGDPRSLQSLLGQPQLFGTALQGLTQYQTWRNTQNALAAQRVLAAGPEGSESRAQLWRQELDSALAEQRIDQNTYAQYLAQQPSDVALQRLVDMARPIGSEMTLAEIMRSPVMGGGGGGGGGQPPPSRRPPVNLGLAALAMDMRTRAGLDDPPPGSGPLTPPVLPPLRSLAELMDPSAEALRMRERAGLDLTPGSLQGDPPPVPPPQAPPPETRTRRADMLVPPLTPPPNIPLAPPPISSPSGRGGMLLPPGAPVAPPPDAQPPPLSPPPPPVGSPSVGAPTISMGKGSIQTAPPPPGSKGTRENPYTANDVAALEADGRSVPLGSYATDGTNLARRDENGWTRVNPDDPTRVRGWLGTAEAQTPPPGGGGVGTPQSIPGVTVSPQGSSSFETPPWAPGGGGSPLGGEASLAPEAGGGPETIGQVIQRVLSAPSVSGAQRARFWTLMARSSTRDDAMKLLQEIESGGVPLTARQVAETEEGLRREMETHVGPYRQARHFGDRLRSLVLSSPQFGSGTGDIALVFSFIKALDPGSAVLPGEQASVASAPGVSDRLLNLYNRLLAGQHLTPSTRRDMVRAIDLELQTRHPRAIESMDRYRGIARRLRLDPTNIIDDTLTTTPVNVMSSLDDARSAIDRGAPAAEVRARLQEMGIDPRWLDLPR